MLVCQECKAEFPSSTWIDGKRVTLHRRKYCLQCSPIGRRGKCGPKPKGHGKRAKDGRYDLTCTECGRKWRAKRSNRRCTCCRGNERREKHRIKAVECKGGKCRLCGYNRCKRSMDFHHVDPATKSFEIGPNWQRSWKVLEVELDKCVLVCANCHGEIHAGLIDLARMAELVYAIV